MHEISEYLRSRGFIIAVNVSYVNKKEFRSLPSLSKIPLSFPHNCMKSLTPGEVLLKPLLFACTCDFLESLHDIRHLIKNRKSFLIMFLEVEAFHMRYAPAHTCLILTITCVWFLDLKILYKELSFSTFVVKTCNNSTPSLM